MYGRKTPSTYRSTPSVYSHYTGKSSTNLKSSKSLRSLRVPWYQKPILHDAYFLDLQRGSLLTGFFSLFVSLFTFAQSIFELYCLYMATPGFTHTGYYVISYQFVYVGSPPVRNVLIIFSLFSWLGSVVVLITSIVLVNALRKMGTMASLNASLAGSRPTTPHSTVSTMPASQIWYAAEPDEVQPLAAPQPESLETPV